MPQTDLSASFLFRSEKPLFYFLAYLAMELDPIVALDLPFMPSRIALYEDEIFQLHVAHTIDCAQPFSRDEKWEIRRGLYLSTIPSAPLWEQGMYTKKRAGQASVNLIQRCQEDPRYTDYLNSKEFERACRKLQSNVDGFVLERERSLSPGDGLVKERTFITGQDKETGVVEKDAEHSRQTAQQEHDRQCTKREDDGFKRMMDAREARKRNRDFGLER